MWWTLYGYYVMFMCGGQNSWFCKALRIFYVSLFECKCPWMLKTYKLPCVEQRITKLDWKSTMNSVVKFVFLPTYCAMYFSKITYSKWGFFQVRQNTFISFFLGRLFLLKSLKTVVQITNWFNYSFFEMDL